MLPRSGGDTIRWFEQAISKHKVLSNAITRWLVPFERGAPSLARLGIEIPRPAKLKLKRCRRYEYAPRTVFGAGIFMLKVEVKPTWMQTLAAAQKWADEHWRPVGALTSEVTVPCSLSNLI